MSDASPHIASPHIASPHIASPHIATADADVATATSAHCTSVLAGPEPGALYRYAVRSPYATGQQLVLRLAQRDLDRGVRLDTWHFLVSSDDQPDLEGELPRHCDGRGEAEFWGPLGVPGLLDVTEPSWRWPAHLDVGDEFEGHVQSSFGSDSTETERRHRVTARERVSVPAGDFDCLRVDFTESLDGESTPAGSVWIAEGVGLVRSQRVLPDQTQTMELISFEQAS